MFLQTLIKTKHGRLLAVVMKALTRYGGTTVLAKVMWLIGMSYTTTLTEYGITVLYAALLG
jgi:hypothetical protein